ncbi:PASTA domain-containing protein [Sediminicola arcticus]|jgi:beta-lactam-binding protein with PASTA domain|uniref:PASTA domain-containing protein n=1 Tax=Sediminicola arcticus TaxID=1574308 RepID=A0ABV2SXL4_9FLAO
MNFFRFLGSKNFFKQLVLGIVLSLVLVFVIMQWLKSSTNHGDFVIVPDLSKLSVSEMRNVIAQNNLRYEVLDSANYNPKYPRFSVIEQDPPAGNKVKSNRKIYITINPSGYDKVTVPDIIQNSIRNATSKLRAVGLDVQRITYIEEMGKDMVYEIRFKGKYIKPGDQLPKTSKIELVCGRGEISDRVVIKDELEE